MKKQILHEKKEFNTMREVIEWAGSEYSDRCAYSFRNTPQAKDVVRISFNRLRQDVRYLTTQLIAMGCSGKHCAVIGKLSYEWALLYFSLMSAGAVIVPLDREWHSEDIEDAVKKSEVSFVFCDEDIAHKVNTDVETVYMLAKENEKNLMTLLALGHMKYAKSSSSYDSVEIDPDALALMVFTSGTTGKGKGVMLSQRNILSDITSVIPYIDFGKKTVGVLPPHHTYGSTVMLAGHTIVGAEVYISSGLRYIIKELKE